MKYYLLFILFLIMSAGAYTMFEIAHHALGREHDFAPAADTTRLIFFVVWLILLMIGDVILLRHANIPKRNIFILFLSVFVFASCAFVLSDF